MIWTRDAITPTWLNDILRDAGRLDGAEVIRVEFEPIGEQGQTGEVVRLNLEYAGHPGTSPGSLIAKLPPAHEGLRKHMSALGMYHREVGFYRHFADPGIEVPHCFFADIDAQTGEFLLILEDMAECRVGEIWTSAPVEDIRMAVDALAPMHAKWWGSAALRDAAAWLPQHDDMSYYQAKSGGAYKASLPVTEERFAPFFAGYLGRVARQLFDHWEAWAQYREGDAYSLIHADFHPKQLFFPRDGRGRFAVFDWQTVASGPPAMDLARLLLKGLRPAALREHQEDLITRYHSALSASGVEYPMERLQWDLRMRMLVTLYITVFILAQTDIRVLEAAAEKRGANYLERLLTDLEESLEDNRVHEVLESFA